MSPKWFPLYTLQLKVLLAFWLVFVSGCSESSSNNATNPLTDGGAPIADSVLKGDGDGSLSPKCSGAFSIEDLKGNPVTESRKKEYIFDPDKFHTFVLKVETQDWENLQKNALNEEYVPATVEFEGTRYRGAAVRYKGDWTTLKTCFDEKGQLICPKLSMMVRFNKYERCGRFFGLRRLIFNSSVRDSTLMRERVAYNLLRDLGLKASRASHAKLVVNGGPPMVYVLVEAVDKEYLEDRFTDPEGNLYKQIWPASEESAAYLEALRTNEEQNPDVSRMIQLAQTLKNLQPATAETQIAPFIDLAALAQDIAAQVLIGGEDDGPILFLCWDGDCENNNYYWYDEPQNKVALLPWDLDQTFFNISKHFSTSFWTTIPASCEPILPCAYYENIPCPDPDDPSDAKIKPPQCEPLLYWAIKNHADAYHALLKKAPAALEKSLTNLKKYRQQISAAVAADSTSTPLAQFNEDCDWLEKTLGDLKQAVNNYLKSVP